MSEPSESKQNTNIVSIVGRLSGRDAMRFTPAKIPVISCRIQHQSRQIEANGERDVVCELEVRALGEMAQQINALPVGITMLIRGFLAAKNAKNLKPVVHVTEIELLEGMNHGL